MAAASKLQEATFDALGSPIRRRIIRIFAPGARPVGQIAKRLPVSRPAVSKHLLVLEEADLVRHEQRGNSNVYRLHRAGFEAARLWLDGFWDEARSRPNTQEPR